MTFVPPISKPFPCKLTVPGDPDDRHVGFTLTCEGGNLTGTWTCDEDEGWTNSHEVAAGSSATVESPLVPGTDHSARATPTDPKTWSQVDGCEDLILATSS